MLTDHLGTVRDLVNNSGSVVNHFTYDSFGKVLTTSGTVDTRYKYTGRELDAETGLYYYRARYFDANVGRFIGQDPIGFSAGDSNLYRYVFNSPLNNSDPSGLEVRGIFNRGAGRLTLEDISQGSRKGRKITVEVFTGTGKARNNPSMESQKGEGPIPSGRYAIVNNPDDTNPSHREWYRLDAFDEKPFNDHHEPTNRDGFRLHPGYNSLGCITVDMRKPNWDSKWRQIRNFLETTEKSAAFDRRSRKRQLTQPLTGASLVYYGDVWVDQRPITPASPNPDNRPNRGVTPY
jgi:RHS repeat-associated protein